MSSTENSSPAAANAPPDDKQAALIEEIERDPKAFFAKTDAIGAEGDDLKAIALARTQALGQWAHDQWNPHAQEPKRGKVPKDGQPQGVLAEMIGCTQSYVSRLILAHRAAMSGASSFSETLNGTEDGGGRKRHADLMARGRMALRDEPEEIAPEIAKAMEDPKVAKAVQAAMSNKAKQAVAAMFAQEDEAEDDEGDEPTLAAVPDPPKPRATDPYYKKGDRRLRNKLDANGLVPMDDDDLHEVIDLHKRDAQKATQAATEAITDMEQRLATLSRQIPRSGRIGKPTRDDLAKAVKPVLELSLAPANATTQELVERMADDYDPDGKKDADNVVRLGVASS